MITAEENAPDLDRLRDSDALKRAETALRESEERFRKVFESAPYGAGR